MLPTNQSTYEQVWKYNFLYKGKYQHMPGCETHWT